MKYVNSLSEQTLGNPSVSKFLKGLYRGEHDGTGN
jgi:hypothetical protein